MSGDERYAVSSRKAAEIPKDLFLKHQPMWLANGVILRFDDDALSRVCPTDCRRLGLRSRRQFIQESPPSVAETQSLARKEAEVANLAGEQKEM